jgi:hypothetical protein
MADVVDTLVELSKVPLQKEAFDAWLGPGSAIEFLRDNSRQDEFVVYASTQFTFIHAITTPTSSVNPPNTEDLMSWNCNATSSWGITVTFSEPRSVSISPPLDHTGSETLNGGEQLVFARDFEGRPSKKGYYEILQKFTHIFGLHFMEEHNAYCRLDKHGDIEKVIRIVEIQGKGDEFGGTIVTFNRALLDEYLVLTDSAIIRTFDFTRYKRGQFSGWSGTHSAQYQQDGDVYYRSHLEAGYASYMRGFQIVRSFTTKESIIYRFDPAAVEDRQYASFIAYDWKNKLVREISCAPGQTANYFTKSDLPFELSPAFFKPEVLLKYKADSDKYRLDDRKIYCRGAWSLETYDINDAGQVHTYLVYLRNIPYEEQLYWKSYNERPKASISKRAMKTDFEGDWYLEYDPLSSLKEKVRELNREQVPWWTLRAEDLLDRLHYPVTSSPDEWANEVLQLDQLVVEGFETKWLRSKAQSLGRTPNPAFASLKLAEECLVALGFAEADAQSTVAPLREAHDLRSKVKGHASGQEGAALKKQVLAQHGNYKKHFQTLCEKCDESFRAIAEAFKKLN